jgi:pimeloyl-ACP methyl ester carboxylesterase
VTPAFPDRLPDWVLDAPEPSRAVHPRIADWVVDEDGVRVFYEVYGDSQDVVCLLPPWPVMHSRAWRAQIAYLARHFSVIAIDPRGNGRSDRPSDWGAYSREKAIGDVLAVLDAAGVEDAMMISGSPRAVLLLGLCVDHPERVRAGVFITPQLWIEEDFARAFTSDQSDAYEGMEKMSRHYWRQDWRGFVEWFGRWSLSAPHSSRPIEEMVREGLQTDGETLVRATAGLRMYERDEALALARQVRCPVLVTQNGGEAKYPKHTSGPLAEATGGRLHVFPGLGPNVGGRWPVAMNIVLREFLESVRAGEAKRDEEPAAA